VDPFGLAPNMFVNACVMDGGGGGANSSNTINNNSNDTSKQSGSDNPIADYIDRIQSIERQHQNIS